MRALPSWPEVIARYGLKLSRAGASFRGPCPLHGGGNRTAFVITPGKGFFCHACGENGGVLRFLELMRDPEATEWTENGRGVASGIYTSNPSKDTSRAIVCSQEALREVAPIDPLDPDHAALRARGVSKELASVFGCGFYDGSGEMRQRIVFPVHDASGRLVGHIGRSIDSREPRYRFSTGLRKSLLLYNEHRVRMIGAEKIIVVEGVFDVMAVHAAGYTRVVSPLGCQLSSAQIHRIRRFKRIWILFDADDAGRNAAAVACRSIGDHASALSLPAADPANVRRETLAAALAIARGHD